MILGSSESVTRELAAGIRRLDPFYGTSFRRQEPAPCSHFTRFGVVFTDANEKSGETLDSERLEIVGFARGQIRIGTENWVIHCNLPYSPPIFLRKWKKALNAC